MVFTPIVGGMAEWLKAAVLKTVVRKYRGFESYFLRHNLPSGEVTELADGARLLSECGGYTPPRVRIPPSPPSFCSPALLFLCKPDHPSNAHPGQPGQPQEMKAAAIKQEQSRAFIK